MPHPTTTPWNELRSQMICREAIIARMAEDIADIAYHRGLDMTVTENDLLLLGWTQAQVATHRAAVIAAAYRNRHEPVQPGVAA